MGQKIHSRFNHYFIAYKKLNNIQRKPVDVLKDKDYILIKNGLLSPNFNNKLVRREYNKYIKQLFPEYKAKELEPYDIVPYLKNESDKTFEYTNEKGLSGWSDKQGDSHLCLFHKNELVGVIKYGYYLNDGNYLYKNKYIYEMIYIDVRKDYQYKGLSELLLVHLNRKIPSLNLFTTTHFSRKGEKAHLEDKIKKIMYNQYLSYFDIQTFIKKEQVKRVKSKLK